MTTLEYTKSNDEFLLTSYKEGAGEEICLRFFPEYSGEVYLRNDSFTVKGGRAFIKRNVFTDGTVTPLLKTDGGSFVCEKLKCESGSVIPAKPTREITFILTKRLISAENTIVSLEKRVAELSEAVYGKSIF